MTKLKEVRCPVCNRRLFDVDKNTVGQISIRCICKNKVLVRYYSFDRIVFTSK